MEEILCGFFMDCLKGFFLGAGAILPGFSSGVLCVIFGIYEKLLNSILGLFKDFKTNFLFLLPFALGGFLGVFFFSNVISDLLISYEAPTKFAFIGLVLGSIPIIIKKSANTHCFKLHYLFYFIFAFLIGLLSIFFENSLCVHQNNYSFYSLIFAGFCMSFGCVIPGVSSTIILMCFGIYEIYLSSIATLNFAFLFPFGIGLCGGSIFCLFLMKHLFEKYHMQTVCMISGFMLGSCLMLYPGIRLDFSGLICIVIFFCSFFLSFAFEKNFS